MSAQVNPKKSALKQKSSSNKNRVSTTCENDDECPSDFKCDKDKKLCTQTKIIPSLKENKKKKKSPSSSPIQTVINDMTKILKDSNTMISNIPEGRTKETLPTIIATILEKEVINALRNLPPPNDKLKDVKNQPGGIVQGWKNMKFDEKTYYIQKILNDTIGANITLKKINLPPLPLPSLDGDV